MNNFTIFSLFMTFFALILTHLIYRLVLKPWFQIRAYRNIPGVKIIYKLGKKEIRTYDNLKEEPILLKTDSPFLITELNTRLLKNPDLRVIVSNLATHPEILIFDHQLGAEVIKNHDYYTNFLRTTIIGKYFLRYAMIMSTGEEWKRQRKIISKAFDFESMRKLIPIIEDVAKEIFSDDFTNGREPQKLHSIFLKFTWEAISRSFFGDNLKQYKFRGLPFAEGLNRYVKSQFDVFMDPQYQIFGETAALWNSKIRDSVRGAKEIGKVAERMVIDVTDRIKKGELKNADGRKGILELIQESSKEQNDSLSLLQLIANFFSFSFAGTDPSSNTSTNLLFCLETYPEAKKKVLEDIQAHWDGKIPLTWEILNKMEYLQALIFETLRVMTPVPAAIFRVAKHDHMIGDIPVKKGYLVRPFFAPTWFSPSWIKDPDQFIPERWIKGNEQQEHLKDVFIFNPFSFGPRNCIGQHFAVAQMKVALCYFLTKFDFNLPTGFKLSPMVIRGPQEPEEPIKMFIRPKQTVT